MTEKQEAVQEAEFTEVEVEESPVKCEITIGTNAEGNLYFKIGGEDQSLITIEGLLRYGVRHIDKVWADRLEASAK